MNDKPLRVLVVDDEPQIRRFLRTSLGAHGYQVIEASCGKEALVSMTTERPDLVLLDLGLPDLDGLAVIHQVREWS
jgi:two-component system, OmpR family, KDP operon response regulator KdpE